MSGESNTALPRLEGGTLYVTPEQFDRLHTVIANFVDHPEIPYATDSYRANYDALRAIGLMDGQIATMLMRETKVIVSYE